MTSATQRVVVDTNVVIYLLQGHTEAQRFRPLLEGRLVLVSFQTVAELYRMACRRNWGEQRLADLTRRLAATVVVPANRDLAERWGTLVCEQQKQGLTIDLGDAWIAAVALVMDAPLVTNDGGFRNVVGLRVLPEDT